MKNKLIYECNKEIHYFFSKEKIDILNISLVSRLLWKNIVFKVEAKCGDNYSIKIILNKCDCIRRVTSEMCSSELLANCYKSFTINCESKILIINSKSIYAMIINKWVEGISYMEFLKTDFPYFKEKILPSIYKICTELWNSKKIPKTVNIIRSNMDRYNFNKEEVFLETNFLNIGEQLYDIYKNIKLNNNKISLINTDFSLHEFLLDKDNQLTIIDWEEIALGNHLMDVAGLFYSIFQYIAEFYDIEYIYNFLCEYLKGFNIINNHYSDFVFYFIERVMVTNYLTKENNDYLLKYSLILVNRLLKKVNNEKIIY